MKVCTGFTTFEVKPSHTLLATGMMNKKCDGTSRMAADRVAAEGWLKTSNRRWHLLNNDLKGRCLQDACALLETLPQLSRDRQKIIIHEVCMKNKQKNGSSHRNCCSLGFFTSLICVRNSILPLPIFFQM
jgi:hypothetical protein